MLPNVRLFWRASWSIFVLVALFAESPASAYDLDGELEATHCEFYVDSLGVGEIHNMDHESRFLDVYFRVNEKEISELQGETILAVGAVMKARSYGAVEDHGKPLLDVLDFVDRVFATRVAPSSWQLRYTFEERQRPQTWLKEVAGLAFFMDIQRGNGKIQRLWARSHGDFFPVDGLFQSDPGTEMSIGIGKIRFPANDSVVFLQKQACATSH